MGDSPSLTGSVECGSRRSLEGIQHAHGVDASAGCLSGHTTSLLRAGDKPICIALEPSAASLCVTASRPQYLSSGCLSTGLKPVEEFHHPPVVLLPRILQKVRTDKATALLVAPDWPGQPWSAQIQLMLPGTPYPLPKEKSLLSLPFDQEAVHPLWLSLNLTVWPISGQPARRQVSLKR